MRTFVFSLKILHDWYLENLPQRVVPIIFDGPLQDLIVGCETFQICLLAIARPVSTRSTF